jgi:AcrR family transcriptional regulator
LHYAGQLLDERGVEELSLRDLAKRARVSPGAPYRHFENKEALLAALAEDAFVELESAISTAAAKHDDDPIAQLRALAQAYVQLATQRPHVFRMMFTIDLGPSRVDEGIFRACDRVYAGLVAIFTAGQKLGRLRQGEIGEQSFLFWSTIHGFSMLANDGKLDPVAPDMPARLQIANQMVDLLLTGLEAKAAPASRSRRA